MVPSRRQGSGCPIGGQKPMSWFDQGDPEKGGRGEDKGGQQIWCLEGACVSWRAPECEVLRHKFTLCMWKQTEMQPRCWRALKGRREMWQSPSRGCQGSWGWWKWPGRKKAATATCSRTHQHIARKQNSTEPGWSVYTGCFWVACLLVVLISF